MVTDNLPAPATKAWEFFPVSQARVDELARVFGLAPLVARILASREFQDIEAFQSFLEPRLDSVHDPFLMKDMDAAVDRIAQGIARGEKIAVYGDYDADGLTATALLVRCFEWLGHPVETYIPHRLNEGYGMSIDGIENLSSRGVKLIVTVDNGISCAAEVRHARSMGVDVVITDHHQPEATLPEAVAVVDPMRTDCQYPFKHLAGVGVAFKVAHALAKRLERDPGDAKAFLRSQLDLVALGTVADVMPLVNENRALVMHGLLVLEQTDKVGLEALSEGLGMDGRRLTGENIAFMFGPRLNAAGRTGEAEYALELLLTRNKARARELAEYLDELNKNRRSIEGDVLKEAIAQLEADPTLLELPVLVLAGLDWHQGIIGIVASRLLERFSRPAVILSIEDGTARGSARSVQQFNIHSALNDCAELLESFGGHKLAAGVSLSAERIDEFRQRLNAVARTMVTEEAMAPRLGLQTQARLDELTLDALQQLDRLRPFGNGNPAPLVGMVGCRLAGQAYEVGGRHLKMRLEQEGGGPPITALWFGYPEPHDELRERLARAEKFDVAGAPMINEWNGRRSVEINVKDIRFPEV